MAKIAYVQCPTGVAGDMLLGALCDAGLPFDYLVSQLQRLNLSDEYDLIITKVHKQGQQGIKVDVNLKVSHHHHRHLPEIEQIIKQANLPDAVTKHSLAVFGTLAKAEGAVHGISPQKVHFHEVGATDAIIDIVGACIGFDYLGITEIYCSPLPTGGGTVTAAHGRLSVPVPAVLELFKYAQVPIYSNGIERELVTPTGAAIMVTLAQSFGNAPSMNLLTTGRGAGTIDLPIPNLLQLWVGEKSAVIAEEVAVLETQIDDLNPQIFGYLFECLLEGGALDVFTQPVTMKKSRLGTLLTVISPLSKVAICEGIIFRETSTLGIRKQIQSRSILQREFKTVTTPYGEVRVKLGVKGADIVNIQPEYEDCVTLAKTSGLPLKTIMLEAQKSFNG